MQSIEELTHRQPQKIRPTGSPKSMMVLVNEVHYLQNHGLQLSCQISTEGGKKL